MKKYIINSVMAVATLFGLAACQADMDAPALVEPVATMKPNTTLADFKTTFADQTVLCPVKDEATGEHYILHGRVISSDATGNIYKSIVIQDETAALTLSINQGSTYTDYRLGQDVVIDATGLYIGYYNGLQQLGWYDLYDGEPSMTFMAWDIFLGHNELNGFPNTKMEYVNQNGPWPSENAYTVVTSINKLPTAGEEFRNMQSQLVEFRNVYFVDGGKETYAPYQESVNRTIKDASGNEIICRTSGYSNFYNDTIPAGTGNVRGILSYYGDAWQLLLRSTYDVMIGTKGQKTDPYTVAEAIEAQNEGVNGWVDGYIVGTVKAGVQTVTSNDDIIFGSDAELPNNLVIAASADVTDWTQCIVVDLPLGSAFREAANMVDHPDVYKKHIIVSGNLSSLYGMPGIADNGGTASDVEINGITIGNGGGTTPVEEGDGSLEHPYSIDYVINSTSDATGVWVEGYVVGYVADMTWPGTAVFGTTATEGSTNYTNGTNCILSSEAPANASSSNSVPCGLSTTGDVRATLGISKNPSIYGQKVKVKGDITKYFGTRAVKNVTEYDINGSGGGSGDDPNPPSGDGDGSLEKPFSIEYVSNSTADATGVWIEGYVAGYVPAMTWSEAVFGTTATEGSTNYTNATNCILSSASASSANLNNSVPCGLSNTGDVRATLGISKNPSIYGKKVKVKGDITKYFGIRGIKNVTEYVVDGNTGGGGSGGDDPNPPITGQGDGSETNPFTVTDVMNSTSDATEAWIVGYVAGYVPAMTWTEAVFGTTATDGSTNYTNATNCILSSVAPTASGLDNSVPCGLKNTGDVRTTLGISKNPGIYGKKVMVKGEITKYFGIRGVKNVIEFKILD